MSKNGIKKEKYCIHWETHAKNLFRGFCSLMEHQSLVDIVLCCGNQVLHAHKLILAANSPYFREEFEKNPSTEQVLINGCDFAVLKSIIELMYCGQTLVSEEQVKYLVALTKLFQMRSLENLFNDEPDYILAGEEVFLPKPVFLTKKPKYPAYPFNTNGTDTQPLENILKPINYSLSPQYKPSVVKRKLRLQAEQACVKEAHASRIALASLQKEIAAAPQVNSFIIEESCTETTVQNFIPNNDPPNYMQVMNYSDAEDAQFIPQDHEKLQGLSAEKIKHALGVEIPANAEIIFKTNDGSYVTVTDEVLKDLSAKDVGLQYQVVDENGEVGELQELRVMANENATADGPKIEFVNLTGSQNGDQFLIENDPKMTGDEDVPKTVEENYGKDGAEPIDMDLETSISPPQLKDDVVFSPDIFFADLSPKRDPIDMNMEKCENSSNSF